MSDIAAIDYINQIDFSQGFQRFHINWPLNNLEKPNTNAVFKTKVVDGQREITLPWKLSITEDAGIITGFEVRLESNGMVIPTIYRIALSSTRCIFDRGGFGLFGNGDVDHGHNVPSNLIDGFPTKDLTLHLWMYIPTAILNETSSYQENARDVDDLLQERSTNSLLLHLGKLFNRATEAGDSSSDISIMVNNEDEEIRHFHCHAVLLQGFSLYFERMMASARMAWINSQAKAKWDEDFKMARYCDIGLSVKICDIKAHIMEIVLRYIYTLKLPDPSTGGDDLFDIMYAADKYDVTNLKNWCGAILILKHGSPQSRVAQLILADRHNLQQLKSVCLAQLAMSFTTAFSDRATALNTPSHLWTEVMKAFSVDRICTKTVFQEEG